MQRHHCSFVKEDACSKGIMCGSDYELLPYSDKWVRQKAVAFKRGAGYIRIFFLVTSASTWTISASSQCFPLWLDTASRVSGAGGFASFTIQLWSYWELQVSSSVCKTQAWILSSGQQDFKKPCAFKGPLMGGTSFSNPVIDHCSFLSLYKFPILWAEKRTWDSCLCSPPVTFSWHWKPFLVSHPFRHASCSPLLFCACKLEPCPGN